MAEIIGMYTAIQNRLIEHYGIILCDGTFNGKVCDSCDDCTHRCGYYNIGTGVNKRVRNWKQENTVESTYILLHEIGHTEAYWNVQFIDEYEASVFAIKKCRELGLNLPREIVAHNQANILRIYRRQTAYLEKPTIYPKKKPDYVKTAEDYNILRVYDEVYDFDLREYVRNLNR